MNNIGEIIKKTREDRCISRSKLANMVGIARTTLIAIEEGGDVKLDTLNRILFQIGMELKVVKTKK